MEKGAIIKHNIKNANKTGSWRSYRPIISEEGCIGCGTCVKYCPEACIDFIERKDAGAENSQGKKKSKMLAKIGYDFCKGCGVCADVCPVKVIAMKKE